MPMKWVEGTKVKTREPSIPSHQKAFFVHGFVSFHTAILVVITYLIPLRLRICGSDAVMPKTSGCQHVCEWTPSSRSK